MRILARTGGREPSSAPSRGSARAPSERFSSSLSSNQRRHRSRVCRREQHHVRTDHAPGDQRRTRRGAHRSARLELPAHTAAAITATADSRAIATRGGDTAIGRLRSRGRAIEELAVALGREPVALCFASTHHSRRALRRHRIRRHRACSGSSTTSALLCERLDAAAQARGRNRDTRHRRSSRCGRRPSRVKPSGTRMDIDSAPSR